MLFGLRCLLLPLNVCPLRQVERDDEIVAVTVRKQEELDREQKKDLFID